MFNYERKNVLKGQEDIIKMLVVTGFAALLHTVFDLDVHLKNKLIIKAYAFNIDTLNVITFL